MAKDREYACIFYLNEGNCSKGHAGTFHKSCQTCQDYSMRKGSAPKRKNLKKEKTLKWINDKRNWF